MTISRTSAQHDSHRRLRRRAGVLALNGIVNSIGGFVFWAVAARRLDAATVGSVAALVALFPLVASLSSLGLGETITRHFAHWPNRRTPVVAATLLAAVVGMLVGIVWWSMVASSPAVGPAGVLLFALLGGALAVGTVSDLVNIVRGRPIWTVVSNSAAAAVKVVVALTVTTPVALFAGTSAAVIAAATIGTLVVLVTVRNPSERASAGLPDSYHRDSYHRDSERLEQGTIALLRDTVSDVRSFAVANWLSGLVSLAPVALLPGIVALRQGPDAAAWVAIPMLAMTAIGLVPSVVSRSFFATASSHPDRLAALTRTALALALGVTAVAAVAVAVVGPWVLSFLGSEYNLESTTLLRLFCIASVCSVGNYIGDVVLNVRRDSAGYMMANIGGAGWLLVCMLVSTGYGINAIGIGWIVGQIGYGTLVWTLVKRRQDRFSHPADASA